MSNKRFDFSVLPDGFLLQQKTNKLGLSLWQYIKVSKDNRWRCGLIRPALNYWHFNDGSMVLPDGLVVEARYSDHDVVKCVSGLDNTLSNLYYSRTRLLYVVAVRIIGAHPDYAEHAKELGMPVVEL